MNWISRVAPYITRYAPSEKRLRQYLSKKYCQDIDGVLSSIHFDEILMGDMWMRTFVSLGKWEQEIKLKLQKKEFSPATILQLMDKFAYEVHDWESNRHAIEYQMRTLESRGKSKQAIKNLLGTKYRYFRDEIVLLLEWMTDDSQLTKEIERYLPRYNISLPHEKQKFYQAILRKWFSYEDIKNWLKKRENLEN